MEKECCAPVHGSHIKKQKRLSLSFAIKLKKVTTLEQHIASNRVTSSSTRTVQLAET